jgi:hypothetical protein
MATGWWSGSRERFRGPFAVGLKRADDVSTSNVASRAGFINAPTAGSARRDTAARSDRAAGKQPYTISMALASLRTAPGRPFSQREAAVSDLPELIPMPEVREALGFSSTRPTVAALERFGVKVIRLSKCRHAIRRDDFDRLLELAASERTEPMPTDITQFRHLAGPKAIAIGAAIDGTVSAATLCQSGIPYPTAVYLASVISGGLGSAKEVDALFRLGFSASDAAAIAAASLAKGAH